MAEAPKTNLPHPTPATDAEKAENKSSFIRNIVGIRTKPKVEDKPGDKAPEPKPGDKAAEKPGEKVPDKNAPKPGAKKVAAKKVEQRQTVDLETAKELVVEGVREALRPTERAVAEPKAEDALSAKDKKKFAIFEQMEKNNPTNAGLSKKFVESLKKHEEYQKDWEVKNPGKKFDITEPDHADFIATNDIPFDEDEYIEALTDLKSNGAIKKLEERFDGEMSGVKRAERARTEAPMVYRHQASTAKIFFNEMGDQFGKVLGEQGEINTAEIKRLCEENPIYEKVFPIARGVEDFAAEIFKIARGHIVLDPEKPTPLQREIIDYATKQEQIFDKLSEDQKLNQHGQMFTTSAKFEKMSKAQQQKHWVLTDKDYSTLYAADASIAAKKLIESEDSQFKKVAEKRGYTVAAKDQPPAKAEDKTNAGGEEQGGNRRPPPSTVAPRMAPNAGGEKDSKKASINKLLGR